MEDLDFEVSGLKYIGEEARVRTHAIGLLRSLWYRTMWPPSLRHLCRSCYWTLGRAAVPLTCAGPMGGPLPSDNEGESRGISPLPPEQQDQYQHQHQHVPAIDVGQCN